MKSLQKSLRLVLFTSCLFVLGVSFTHAEEKKQSTMPDMDAMMGMMNPTMYMNMMNHMMTPMTGMMNPNMMMNPMMGMMNPTMMMSPMMGMMNPMMGMNMMYPMMGMMGPMMNPMMGMGMGMPGMGSHGGNPMNQMPGAQMMDPKQYEQWFSQWTEMMQNFTQQGQASTK